MEEKKCEINGNLEGGSIEMFNCTVISVYTLFVELFGKDLITKLPLFVDNATRGSGNTPITIPVLRRFVIIKLGIEEFTDVERIIYQFSHELCHFIYYCLYGIDKELADEKEEAICTAMSLCCLKYFCKNIDKWTNHVQSLKREGYRNGFEEAQAVDFDAFRLSKIIIDNVAEQAI